MSPPKRLTMMGLALSLTIAGTGLASAQGWSRYTDPAFGTRIDVPVGLFGPLQRTTEGVIFRGRQTKLEISAKSAPGIGGARDLRAAIGKAPGYDRVDYTPSGSNWLVVSGFRGSMIFYEKYFVANGVVEGFSFEYPIAERRFYDPVVEHMEDTFRPGRARR